MPNPGRRRRLSPTASLPREENLENALADLAADTLLRSRLYTAHDWALQDLLDALEPAAMLSR